MQLTLTEDDRATLERAAAGERRVRHWRRYRALLLLGADAAATVPGVAAALGCCPASVYNWLAAWRRAGVAGLGERPHGGRGRCLDPEGERLLEALLRGDPQAHGQAATGWTVPLLRHELGRRGYALSARTLRRAVHRLGWRRERPTDVLGRPDPEYAEKKGAGRRPRAGDAGRRRQRVGGRRDDAAGVPAAARGLGAAR